MYFSLFNGEIELSCMNLHAFYQKLDHDENTLKKRWLRMK